MRQHSGKRTAAAPRAEASRANRRLVEGRRIRLEYDTRREDRHGRTLAYVYADEVFVNARPDIVRIAARLRERRLVPECEVYDAGMLETLRWLLDKGHLAHPYHVQFVLGVPGGTSGTERNLRFLVEGMPEAALWTVAGIGRFPSSPDMSRPTASHWETRRRSSGPDSACPKSMHSSKSSGGTGRFRS